MTWISEKFKVSKENVPLLLTIYYIFFSSGLMNTLIGLLLPYIKTEYNIGYALSGMILSTYQMGGLVANLISGVLPYKLGRKKSTVILSTGITIGMILMTVSGLPPIIVMAFVAIGISRGTFTNISNVTISDISGNKSASLNVLHAIFAIGALISPFILMLTTKSTVLGWRGTAWIVAAIGLGGTILLQRSQLPNEPSSKAKDGKVSFWNSFGFWIDAGIFFFYLSSEASIVGWLVTYFKDTQILSSSWAQMTPFVLWTSVMVGRFICAYISTKVNKNILLICMTLVNITFFTLMISTQNPIVIIISIMGVGLGMSGIFPTNFSTIDPQFSSSTIASGTCIAVGTLGAIIMPTIVGAIAETNGIGGGIRTIFVALIILLALTIVKFYRSRLKVTNEPAC